MQSLIVPGGIQGMQAQRGYLHLLEQVPRRLADDEWLQPPLQ